jgi:hypothetical protein
MHFMRFLLPVVDQYWFLYHVTHIPFRPPSQLRGWYVPEFMTTRFLRQSMNMPFGTPMSDTGVQLSTWMGWRVLAICPSTENSDLSPAAIALVSRRML